MPTEQLTRSTNDRTSSTEASELVSHYDARRESLRAEIDEDLGRATSFTNRLRRTDRRYGLTSTALGGAAGVVAGLPAATGVAPGGWQFTCVVVALIAFGGTLVGALRQHVSEPDVVAKANERVGKLRSLRLDTVSSRFDVESIGERYQQVLAEYSDLPH